MKSTTLIFLIFLLFLALKIFGIFPISNWILFGIFLLWFIVFYYRTHSENKKQRTPMPVYLSNPYQQ